MVRFGSRKVAPVGALVIAILAYVGIFGIERDTSPYASIGQAPDFTLTDEHGDAFTLSDVEGKVTLVSFMFTRCYDLCPILTSKLATMQGELRAEYGTDIYFVSVTVDPDFDRPEVLKEFAENLDYHADSWSFLTGEHGDVRRLATSFGVLMAEDSRDTVNHSLLTTVIDRKGVMRVQYLGERFDTDELLADIRAIAGQASD